MLRESEFMPVLGTLSKGKIHCSCRMCRYEQYHSIPKAKHKAKLKAMKKEIDDYVYFLFTLLKNNPVNEIPVNFHRDFLNYSKESSIILYVRWSPTCFSERSLVHFLKF